MRLLSAQKLFSFFYLLFLFSLPTQLGKHFWPSFAHISGLRIDYLSPTLFFTDVLFVPLLVLFLLTTPLPRSFRFNASKNTLLATLFVLLLIAGILVSKSPLAGVMGMVRLIQMALFALMTVAFFKQKQLVPWALTALGASVFFEATLGMAQFFLKSSVGGILYFFGERSFTMLTPGIANASLHGSLVLRPYGTLPHPNVLAGFLLIGCLFLLGNWNLLTKRITKLAVLGIVGVSIITLFLSLSRTTLAMFGLLILVGGFFLVKRSFSRKTVGILSLILLGIGALLLTTPVLSRFLSSSVFEEAFLFREDVAINAFWMIWSHPLLGVGLQNFLYFLPTKLSSYSYFTQVQPVHNIYLLTYAELGIICGSLFAYFLYKTVQFAVHATPSLWQKIVLVMFCCLLSLGLFDHYLLTLHQGQLLFAFVIGLVYSLPQSSEKLPRRKSK